jgi:hypothetical protein
MPIANVHICQLSKKQKTQRASAKGLVEGRPLPSQPSAEAYDAHNEQLARFGQPEPWPTALEG